MPTKKIAPRITISVPSKVRVALQKHVEALNESESGFIADLLKQVLNVGEGGGSAEASSRLFNLVRSLSAFPTSGTNPGLMGTASMPVVEELQQGDYQRGGLSATVPWFLLASLSNPERMRHAAQGQDVYIPRVEYSIPDVQEALIALTLKWNMTRLFGLNFTQLRPAAEAFDAIINLEFALSTKSIFPFPCFQTEFRRSMFGVIPYGHHVAIGWLVHKDNPLAKTFQLETFERDALMFTPEAAAKRLQFLSELFANVSRGAVTLFTRDNYLHREMLPLLKSNAQHGLQVSSFSSRKFATTLTDHPEWPPADLGELTNQKCVLLYDLATDKELARKSQEKNFLSIPFLHDQDIPVGIGFSLPTLPFMARAIDSKSKKTVAETLREEAQKAVMSNASRIESDFWRDGILLDADFRSSPRETDESFSTRMCNASLSK